MIPGKTETNAVVSHLRTIIKVALLALGCLIIVTLICVSVPKYAKLHEFERRRDHLRKESQELAEKTQDVRTKRESFVSDPSFVERTAREIGMVKPDEVVFKFTNDHAQAPAPDGN